MRPILTPLLILAMGGLAQAQVMPPVSPVVPVAKITAPEKVVAGNPVVIYTAGSVSAKPVKLKVKPAGTPFQVASLPNGDEIGVIPGEYTLANPGAYRFQAVAVGNDDVDVDTADTVVAPVLPVSPTVDPVSPPTPKPIKPAFTGHLWAILILNLDDPSTTPVRVSSIAADLKSNNCDWRFYGSESEDGAKFAAWSAKDGIPVVYILNDAGKIVGTVKAPTSKDQVIAAVNTLRAGN